MHKTVIAIAVAALVVAASSVVVSKAQQKADQIALVQVQTDASKIYAHEVSPAEAHTQQFIQSLLPAGMVRDNVIWIGCPNLMHRISNPTVAVDEQVNFEKALRDVAKQIEVAEQPRVIIHKRTSPSGEGEFVRPLKVAVFGRTIIPCPPRCAD